MSCSDCGLWRIVFFFFFVSFPLGNAAYIDFGLGFISSVGIGLVLSVWLVRKF